MSTIFNLAITTMGTLFTSMFIRISCSWGRPNNPVTNLASCQIDGGYDCMYSDFWQRDACNEICGDAFRMHPGVYTYNDMYTPNYWNYLNGNQCDDGQQIPGDGCDPKCRIERGWICNGGIATEPDICNPMCGDWRVFHNEKCDDGNLVAGDGCDANCDVERGYSCDSGSHLIRDTCYEECGDGLNNGYYVCDDGNHVDGDGCSSTCTLEYGFQCTGGSKNGPDTCTEVCGDGLSLGTVECDDGNLLDTDGCSSACKIETGYTCSHVGTGSDTCSEICGDGIMLGFYQCDDGNFNENDGCDANCEVEVCWECSKASPSVCWIPPEDAIGIENVTLYSNNTLLTVQFNNSIVMLEGYDIYSAI